MLKRLVFAGLLVLLAAGAAAGADDPFVMPPDMQKLLPAEPAFIVAIASVNELEDQWRNIRGMLDEGGEEPTGLLDLVGRGAPGFVGYIDPTRPLAVAMNLPDLMAGEEPGFIFVVPFNETFTEQARLEAAQEDVVLFTEGGYLAFSIDPRFEPAGRAPALARGLHSGFLSASLDLEMVVGAYRPLAEMGLGAMGNAAVVPDSAAIAQGAHPPYMDPDEVAAMQELARSVMDSARRFDLSVALAGEELTMHTGFSVAPGSPLDPGPQPPFEHALQLTRLLPDGGHIVQTMALDQTRQFEVFRNYYLATINRAAAAMPPEKGAAYRAWVASYLDSMDLFARPLAASIRMSEQGMSANMVMACEDPAGDMERFAGLFAGLSAADIGIGLKAMPTGRVAGVEVRSWAVEYDPEKLAALSADPLNPKLGGTGRMQAEQMIAILRKVTPGINMAVRGDYLILSADPDPAHLAHMIQQAGQRRGAVHPGTAAVAAKAGPACRQVVTGDLMAILSWITEWMEELDPDEYATIEGNPIPFSAAYTIDGADYGLDWTMDMPAVKRFAAAVRELEEMENPHTPPDVDEADEESPGGGD